MANRTLAAAMAFMVIVAFFLCSTSTTASISSASPDGNGDVQYAPDRIIVCFKDGVAPRTQGLRAASQSGTPDLDTKYGITNITPLYPDLVNRSLMGAGTESPASVLANTYVLTVTSGDDPAKVAAEYAAQPGVRYAEPDYIRHALRTDPNDFYWLTSNSWGQGYRDQWDMEKMACPAAWDVQTGSASVVIAVVDSGVDYLHADIAANAWHNPGEIAGNGIDDDGNGKIDDYYGYDFYNSDSNPMDDNGHGTHCAGTIGAVGNNSTGIAGINWNCQIMAVKGLSSAGSGSDTGLAACIVYAADEGANIISNSWGGGGTSQTIHDALVYAHDVRGCILVVAGGNDSSNIVGYHPAADNYAITVSASDPSDTLCSFSNWGIKTAVAAPGGGPDLSTPAYAKYNCLSLRAGTTNLVASSCIVGTNYYRLAGTSMACPHVAGLAGLILAQHPAWTSEQVRQAIQMQSDDILTSGFDRYSGFGRINAYKSVTSTEPMTAFISSPDNGGTVSGLVSITGTAVGPNFASYTVDVGLGMEPTTWTTIATSSTPVTRGTLADWDSSTFTGSAYTLRLRTVGTGGVLNAEYRLAITVIPTGGSGHFTELFSSTSPFDLTNMSLVFTPDGSSQFYSMTRQTILSLPTDPSGGTALSLTDNSYTAVSLTGGSQVSIYGTASSTFYVGSNGYITMGSGDSSYTPSISQHFLLRRISALFDDLVPPAGSVTWKQLSDRAVVTYLNVPKLGATAANTFQIEMFYDGRIAISYLGIAATTSLAGLSAGAGTPSGFVQSDLSQCGTLITVPRMLGITSPNGGESYEPGQTVAVRWRAIGSGWLPADTVRLEYSSDSGSTWNPIAGASSLAYNAGTFNWDTTGLAELSTYRVRVVFNDTPTLLDTSDANFSIAIDLTAPVITHTALADCGATTGSIPVTATVTDTTGISSATLYYSKNGGAITSVAMTATGVANQYSGNIPGPSVIGDVYHYYIVAVDSARAGNISRSPASGDYSFRIIATVTNTIGDTTNNTNASNYSRGNIFSCTTPGILTQIEHYLSPSASTELRYFVYESTSISGTYSKIFELVQPSSGTGLKWYSSGPIAVPLVSGRYYIIGTAWLGACTYYYGSGHPFTVNFGQSQGGYYDNTNYPPPATTTNPSTTTAYYQRLTSVISGRLLTITSPNGGESYEPGKVVAVRWTAVGANWLPADTVRLEYSTDSGSTWNPIAGASSLAYNAGTFNWDTTGLAELSTYRVRVVFNDDPTLLDASDANFSIAIDLTAPVIAHTALTDCSATTGSIPVLATVTDATGVSSVTLYYSKNGGAINSVAMTATGVANQYSGSIPGPSVIGDVYHYYIVAVDLAGAHNTSRSPASGDYSFKIIATVTDTIGDTTNSTSASNYSRGNIFSCTTPGILTQIEHYLNPSVSTELRYFVYESTSLTGTYSKIFELVQPSSGTGLKWYSSGPISVPMVAGRYYIIGTAWQGTCTYYYGGTHPYTVNFGQSQAGYYDNTNYPPPATTTNPGSTNAYYQRLTSTTAGRSLTITSPNGGESYDPGQTAAVKWTAVGTDWLPTDTVRLEYSTDSGTSWNRIAGALNIPYNAGTYNWNTTGLPQLGTYRMRAAFNDDDDRTVFDVSDGNFAIAPDLTAPVITHTPLGDTSATTGSYVISASVTDATGISSVTLYYSKNGGPITSVAMTATGVANQYSGNIPGPSAIGDVYHYYIMAVDSAGAHNITRSPASGDYSFTIISSLANTVGSGVSFGSATGYSYGNVFTCTTPGILTQIEQYLNPSASTELRYFVYESTSLTGTYNKIFESIQPSSGTGLKWYSSGLISVPTLAGKYYIIGTAWKGTCTYYYGGSHPYTVNFGQSQAGYYSSVYPPAATATNPASTTVYYQRLTSGVPGRALTITSPNGGESYEPTIIVPIRWTPVGTDWLPTDTVKLEYSSDSGSTWNPIAGASSLAYNAGLFNWDTTGLAELSTYRVRVVFNSNPAVLDASNANFSILTDLIAPTITHTALSDTRSLTGPYTVTATITDSKGITSATLYYSKNSGAITSVTMTGTGVANQYSANIPGPSVIGDVYHYYIIAVDAAKAHNSARLPAAGDYSFKILSAEGSGHYTELFSSTSPVDLSNMSLVFVPDGTSKFYTMYRLPITSLPTDPSGGTALTLSDDSYAAVSLTGGSQVSIYGTASSTFYVGSNGYVTMGSGDTSFTSSYSTHFSLRRISALFDDLLPPAGSVTWKQLSDRAVVTYLNVPRLNATTTNTFQIEMFYNGRIVISYLGLTTTSSLAGLSAGAGTPSGFVSSDLSQCGTLIPRLLTVTSPNGGESYDLGQMVTVKWTAIGSNWLSTDKVRLEYSSDSGSTWNPIAGASSLAYNSGTFNWDTTGLAELSTYRVRVVFNDDPTVLDASDANFRIAIDLNAPVITHTPLGDYGATTGSIPVTAIVTDVTGISSVTLYYSKNGGAITSVAMSATGVANQYSGNIPGPSVIGDVYHYYIVAVDSARAGNTSRSPASGDYSFKIIATVTDTIGSSTSSTSAPNYSRGNIFACTTPAVLTQIEHYLSPSATTELRYFVYESTSISGTYNKIFELVQPSSGTGLKWYSSGPISVTLVSGRYYIIGTAWQGTCTYYYGGAHPFTVNFGQSQNGYADNTNYPPPATATNSGTTTVYYQRLTSIISGRLLTITSPNGGESYEPGKVVAARWTTIGANWLPTDTVRLEYSSDSGSTWNPITGASSLAYNAGSFNWDTTGLAELNTYRVRVVFNDDPTVLDASNANFSIATDLSAPVIVHTPVGNIGNTSGPYIITASITDATGISSATLYYSKNGGAITSVAMTATGVANQYSGSIPGPSVVGDVYHYYIVAVDSAGAHNTARSPASGDYSFNITASTQVLSFIQYSDTTATGEYQNTLTAIRTQNTIVNTELTDYTQLSTAIIGKQVLLIPEQENGSLAQMQTIGTAWQSTLNNFLASGGRIIVCDFTGGSYGILTAAGLMSITGATSITGTSVQITNPTSPLVTGVAAPYASANGSNSYTTTETCAIISTTAGQPVVLAKRVGAGYVMLIGHDYYSSNASQDRLVANAVGTSMISSLSSLAELKTLVGDEQVIQLTEPVVVTYAPRNVDNVRTTNYFYVGDARGLGCIRVNDVRGDNLAVGKTVTGLTGSARKSNVTGEWTLTLFEDPAGFGADALPPLSGIAPLGLSTALATKDSIILTNPVKVWGQVTNVAKDGASFTISDGGAGLDVIVNGVSLPEGFGAARYVIVSGILTKDETGKRVVYAQNITVAGP